MREKFGTLEATDKRSLAWAAVLFLAAAAVVVALTTGGYSPGPVWALVVLGFFGAVAERGGEAVTDRSQMSASFLPTIFAAVALGPLGGFVVGAISNASDFRRPFLRWFVYTNVRAITGAATGLVAVGVARHMSGASVYLVASVLASLTSTGVDAAFNCLTAMVRRAGDVADYIRAVAPIFALAIALYSPLIALFDYGYHTYSLWVVVAFLAPALALQRVIHLYQQEKAASRHLAAANARLRTANARFMTGLVGFYEENDPYTAGHSLVVATYARDIAERMGLSEAECDLAEACGLVHDIGKYKVPREIIEKSGSLTLEERKLIEQHPVWGEELVRKIEVEDHGRIAPIVRHHHEWIDGNGYPDRLVDTEIPLLSKIISVADAYQAMTSKRPYREALPSQVARIRLAQAVGTQFDTSVVAAFEAILASADEDYRTGVGRRFVFDWNDPVVEEPAEVVPLRAAG